MDSERGQDDVKPGWRGIPLTVADLIFFAGVQAAPEIHLKAIALLPRRL
jgi:hypothetical protein